MTHAGATQMVTLIDTILDTSFLIEDNRTKYFVLSNATQELGELATEVAIDAGHSYKESGKDGIIGEAIDLIINAVDMIYLENPNITEEELVAIANVKLKKWRNAVQCKQIGFKGLLSAL